MKILPLILLPPEEIPSYLSSSAKWLSGEGAGSWFVIEYSTESSFKIARYSPSGELECQGKFIANGSFDISRDYSMTYPSHCAKVTVEQNKETIQFLPR